MFKFTDVTASHILQWILQNVRALQHTSTRHKGANNLQGGPDNVYSYRNISQSASAFNSHFVHILLHLRHRGCVMFIPDVSSPLLFSTLRTIQKFIFDPQNFTAHSSAGHTCQAQYYDVTNNVTHKTSNTNGKYFGAWSFFYLTNKCNVNDKL